MTAPVKARSETGRPMNTQAEFSTKSPIIPVMRPAMERPKKVILATNNF